MLVESVFWIFLAAEIPRGEIGIEFPERLVLREADHHRIETF